VQILILIPFTDYLCQI